MEAGKLSLLYGIILLGLMSACVKDPQDIPSGLQGDPVFGMQASFGGETILLEAGTDQWTMVPVVQQEDSLSVYTSVLSVDGCTDQCSPSWTFRFYQSLPPTSDPESDFSNTIHPGDKDFVLSAAEVDSFQILLTTHPALFMSGYSYWEDLIGQSSTFYHEFASTVGYEQNLNVCFQSLAYTGCQYTQCIYFDPATEVPCIVSIEPKLESARYMSLSVRPQGTPPFQIQWFNEATSPSIVIPLQDSIAEIYAGVTVIDALGNRADLSQSIRLQDMVVDPCYFPINLVSTPIENTTPPVTADKVEISYWDEDGVEWNSASGIQPTEASVTIDAVNTYGVSPSGQPAYLVETRVKAQLFNTQTGEARWFETNRLSLAVSHP
jgi:hypothetical protein